MRLWMNSKYIKEGDIFLVDHTNKKYVNKAIINNAKAIITQDNDIYEIETKKVDNIKAYFYDYYYEKIKDVVLIGITGTNGKTTTCYLIYQMLNSIGIKAAYIGTIGFYMDDKIIPLDNTTPSMDLLYNLILDAKEKDCKVVIMEVSSHALKQDRTYGLLYDAIGVTNITKEHLDYHKNIDDYIESKIKLTKLLRNKKVCILNKKDKYYKRFINKDNNNFIIGKDIKIKKVKNYLNNTNIVIKDDKIININTSLIGYFNVYNFIMAYKIIKELGFNEKEIIKKSILYKEPLGRMQKIYLNSNVIFVDYAHSPDAVLNVLKTVNKIKNKGIITVIGCGGNRDKTKRPIMAKIASKYSNYVIFTNDNPRLEDEKDIMSDILKGAKGKYNVIYDRYDAIKKGISLLKENMILMILGKGHEDYQIIGNIKYHFSDVETVLDIINN